MSQKLPRYRVSSPLERMLGWARAVEQFLAEAKHKQPVFAFRIAEWKRPLLRAAYPELALFFVPFARTGPELELLISLVKKPVFLSWGYKESLVTRSYARLRGLPFWRMEDGFVRSMGLGQGGARPMSTVLDRAGTLHFDARLRSSLETLLQTYDFDAQPALISRAASCLLRMKDSGVSKYNLVGAEAEDPYERFTAGRPRARRVLVIGQVESDAAVLIGAPEGSDNGRLVWEARRRNPDADVFFKPHPDTLADPRKVATPLADIAAMAHVLRKHVSMASAFASADEVYTISSLAGFEALWHGKPVVTLGHPFYAGWGLTTDLNPVARRTRRLSLEQVFAAAYMLYPRYHHPMSGAHMELEGALDLIDLARKLRVQSTITTAPALTVGDMCQADVPVPAS